MFIMCVVYFVCKHVSIHLCIHAYVYVILTCIVVLMASYVLQMGHTKHVSYGKQFNLDGSL